MRSRLLRTGTAAALFAALATGPALRAADRAVTDELTVALISEQATIRPGDSLTVALHQKIAPHWHTYWRNPGDSGQTPNVVWTLPEGAKATEFRFPAPDRIPYGPLVNYGYSNETALLADIAVPADWPAGQPFPIAGDAEVLVCSDICIPVSATLTLSVPTGPATTPARDKAPLFETTRAQMPMPLPGKATFATTPRGLTLAVSGDGLAAVEDAYFFPGKWGVVEHAAVQAVARNGERLTVTIPRGQAAAGESMTGVLAVTLRSDSGPVRRVYEIAATPGAVAAATDGVPVSATAPYGMLPLLLFALLGGLILNLMPCVFPVLAIKALGFARTADDSPRTRIAHGLAYSGGVIASFLALAGMLLAARAGGEAVGWGFQLQDPLIVGALAYVATAVGLNFSGVFEVGGRFTGVGNEWAAQPGLTGSFATGILAAVVAAPCTAPFMATAAGGALLLPAAQALLIFAVMGLGLAMPYLLLSAAPALARLLPKPGPWMVRFRQALAFPMYATAAWLVWVLAQQAGPDAALLTTLGLILLAAAAWLWPMAAPRTAGIGGKIRTACLAVALAGAVGLLATAVSYRTTPGELAARAPSAEPFSAARLAQLQAEGRTVFVNMTAAWCISCKFNEQVALSGAAFEDALRRHDIVYLQGDWTNRDPEITAFLERFNRAGVPLYVLFPAGGGAPTVLPQILDPGALTRALETVTLPPQIKQKETRS